MPASRIFYLVPDFAIPSWGVGLLFRHVELLRKIGYEAYAVPEASGFSQDWLETTAPLRGLEQITQRAVDLWVVPEVLAARSCRLVRKGRKVVFVQGSYMISGGLEGASSYRELGFEKAAAVLPHVQHVLHQHFKTPSSLLSPVVAEGFLKADWNHQSRARTVLLSCKRAYSQAGFMDREIALEILPGQLQERGYEFLVLEELSHEKVLRAMLSAEALVNLNAFEAFNTTIPEAMAAGAIVFCYEGFGGVDFLSGGVNAHVFPNGYVYPLLEQLLAVIDGQGLGRGGEAMRRKARETAEAFSVARLRSELQDFYRELGVRPKATPQPPRG